MDKIRKFLLYITNNEKVSRHEEEFDIAFFLINTLAAIIGSWLFIESGDGQWVPILVIEYIWALDTIRHNRV